MLEKAKKKFEEVRELNRTGASAARDAIKTKVREAKDDPRYIALIVVDVLFILLIVLALFFLFDPKLSLEIDNPLPWELKLVLFLASVFAAFWLYSYTKEYRKKQLGK